MKGGFAYIIIPALITLLLILGSLKGEKACGENLIFTLPVSRNDILNGRYLSMAVYSLLGMMICLITSFCYSLIPGFDTAGSPSFYEILTGMVSGFFFSWLIPGQLKFGFKFMKGLLMGGIIMGVIFQAAVLSELQAQNSGILSFIVNFIDSMVELSEKRRFLTILGTALILIIPSYTSSFFIMRKKAF